MGVQSITDYPQHYELKTRWKDIDLFGHVNNAVFLTYIEDARIIYFKRWNYYAHLACVYSEFPFDLFFSVILNFSLISFKIS